MEVLLTKLFFVCLFIFVHVFAEQLERCRCSQVTVVSLPLLFCCFFLCDLCSGMCGMHLASCQVDHHSAHWFAVTVRVNLAFAESRLFAL